MFGKKGEGRLRRTSFVHEDLFFPLRHHDASVMEEEHCRSGWEGGEEEEEYTFFFVSRT